MYTANAPAGWAVRAAKLFRVSPPEQTSVQNVKCAGLKASGSLNMINTLISETNKSRIQTQKPDEAVQADSPGFFDDRAAHPAGVFANKCVIKGIVS
jgi:hypothetical protein